MLKQTLINNWATAISEIAIEEKKVELFTKTLEELKEVFILNPDVINFLSNRSITISKRLEFVDKIFKSEIDILILNCLKLIIERESFYSVNYIFTAAIKKLWESLNISKGIIYSTIEIDKKLIKIMEEKIHKKINHEIKLENKIDSSLIAGVRIEVANNVFDFSLKGKAEDMKNSILENRK
ncbi:F0F1 ATP synthase subunit delta [Spiroplasma diminutum]|uniref:ATP synthase subunit delta n=1 Tax=Spiroplasma diminutum CUAS-1 TaxID=1276221 RepID=S5M155_9MOLU|nr:F0F1 ATP synthase subunit delta [Spiroplasma diminutum]AGR41757.1 F0F1 ATP synthase subunit delta [Spiroplasma diminutum CUAS-1]